MANFEEWFKSIVEQLKNEGFHVTVYGGFPLIKEPLTYEQRIKSLEMKFHYPVEKRIYAEGMLIIPRELHAQI